MKLNRYDSLLKEISDELIENRNLEKNIGILDGLSGIALFHFYYAKYSNNTNQTETAWKILNEIISKVNNGFLDPTYCSGISGFGWTIDHLVQENLINIDTDGLLSDFNDKIFQIMMENLNVSHYEFLYGASGYAYYFINRHRTTSNKNTKKRYQQYLEEYVKSLEQVILVGEGKRLKFLFDKNIKETGVNLGVSHGIGGVIGILIELINTNISVALSKKILNNICDFYLNVLSYKTINKSNSKFPIFFAPENDKTIYNNRLAWCYGDLGVAFHLLKASKLLNNSPLKSSILNILAESSNRKSFEETLVRDAGICHGAFGNSIIYAELSKSCVNLSFDMTSKFWFKEGIKMKSFSDGYAGFKQWNGAQQCWIKHLSLLEGISGIGLSIMSLANGKEFSRWSKCLLIN